MQDAERGWRLTPIEPAYRNCWAMTSCANTYLILHSRGSVRSLALPSLKTMKRNHGDGRDFKNALTPSALELYQQERGRAIEIPKEKSGLVSLLPFSNCASENVGEPIES